MIMGIISTKDVVSNVSHFSTIEAWICKFDQNLARFTSNVWCTRQVIREITILEIPFPIPNLLKTQKKFKNPGIFPEFPLEKNHLECWCFYDKYNNWNINTMKVEMHKFTKMLLFSVIYIEMLRIFTVNNIKYTII